jgi:hypothetical protein
LVRRKAGTISGMRLVSGIWMFVFRKLDVSLVWISGEAFDTVSHVEWADKPFMSARLHMVNGHGMALKIPWDACCRRTMSENE